MQVSLEPRDSGDVFKAREFVLLFELVESVAAGLM